MGEEKRRSLFEWVSDSWQRIKERGGLDKVRVRRRGLRKSMRQALWLSRKEREKEERERQA
ncbi:MAG: hypothetical protein JXD18_06505 [Anaerolineae bacterium]|nr:hypothetical protein [Anaerolineae bacterium]